MKCYSNLNFSFAVLHPHDLKRFREWKEKQSKDHQHPTTSDITDNQISEKIKNLEAELKSAKGMLASKEQECQKHLETSRKNDQHYEQQSKVREKEFTEQLKAKEKTLQETDDKLQKMEGAKTSQDRELQNLKEELLKEDMRTDNKNNKLEKENNALKLKVDAYMNQYKTAQDKLKQQEFQNKKEKDKYIQDTLQIETDLDNTKKERDQLNNKIKEFNETKLILKEHFPEDVNLSQALKQKFEEGRLHGLKATQLQKSCNIMKNKIEKLETAKKSGLFTFFKISFLFTFTILC